MPVKGAATPSKESSLDAYEENGFDDEETIDEFIKKHLEDSNNAQDDDSDKKDTSE